MNMQCLVFPRKDQIDKANKGSASGYSSSPTSGLKHGCLLPALGHHVSTGLQNKVTVDELADAGDGEGDLWVQDGEVLVQLDPHGL